MQSDHRALEHLLKIPKQVLKKKNELGFFLLKDEVSPLGKKLCELYVINIVSFFGAK